MSSSYIAIFPSNPLLPNPDKQLVVSKLKEHGFLASKDHEWKNPETESIEIYYRPGEEYHAFFDLFEHSEIDIQAKLKDGLISYIEHEKIQFEVNASGDFVVWNMETGSRLGEEWGAELGDFLDDNTHQWTDPLNQKQYFFFELECSDLGLGRHFITIEDGWGEPNANLMKLLHDITGQEYKWMWTRM